MIQVVLCDIEGTTTALSFVHDVLFPISKNKMPVFIEQNWNQPGIQEILETIGKDPGEIIRILQQWIDADKKDGRLKIIQGKIWKESFESGEIRSHIYPDVPEKWEEWKHRGLRICIFSSGSVEAQKLLFGHSECGDLRPWIDAYFDTSVGSKKDQNSYRKIAESLKTNPEEILFLSDVSAELDSARITGMRTCHIDRDGSVQESPHPIARSFFEIPEELTA